MGGNPPPGELEEEDVAEEYETEETTDEEAVGERDDDNDEGIVREERDEDTEEEIGSTCNWKRIFRTSNGAIRKRDIPITERTIDHTNGKNFRKKERKMFTVYADVYDTYT